jgi:Undecaprenyl-phosphate glucose phosphotransferase
MRNLSPATAPALIALPKVEKTPLLRLSTNGLAAPASKAPTCILHLATALALLSEFISSGMASYAASVLYHRLFIGDALPSSRYIAAALVTATLLLLVSLGLRDFAALQIQAPHVFLCRALRSVALAFSLFLTGLFLLKLAEPYSRVTFLCQFLIVGTTVLGNRAFWIWWIRRGVARGRIEARRVLLIGDKTHCLKFANCWKNSGVQVLACFPFPAAGTSRLDPNIVSPSKFGEDIDTIRAACRVLLPTEIILIETADRAALVCRLGKCFADLPVAVHLVLLDLLDTIGNLATCPAVPLGGIPSIQLQRQPLSWVDQLVKRCFDVVVSLTGLVLMSPVLLIAGLAIKLDSAGPILFRQTRHGFNNSVIRVFKLRTMRVVETDAQFKQATSNDPRITTVGRLLRRCNIDELPQLLNVLTGEMSIVGPRPHATEHNKMFEHRIGMFARRHNVKPGITGWAQINGYRGVTDTVDKMERRIAHDIHYIDNWSLLLDLRIVLLTVFSSKAYKNAC